MALASGSSNVDVSKYNNVVNRRLYFNWEETSISQITNSSIVAWTLKMVTYNNGKTVSTLSGPASVTINGNTYTKPKGTDGNPHTLTCAANSSITILSGTETIPHNEDGTKTFNYSYSEYFNIVPSGSSSVIGTKSGSGTGVLTKIDRGTDIDSATDIVLGNNCSIKFTPKQSTFHYKLSFTCNGTTVTTGIISPNTTSQYTYTGTNLAIATWAPYITNATSAQMTISLYTYTDSGCTQLFGTTYKTIMVTIPNNNMLQPSIDAVSVIDVNGYAGSYGYLKGYSNIRVTSLASGKYGASITSYTTTIKSGDTIIDSLNGNPVTSNELNVSGTITIEVRVVDTRGFVGIKSTNINVVDYSKPTIVLSNIGRCNANGTFNDQEDYIGVSGIVTRTNLNGTNENVHEDANKLGYSQLGSLILGEYSYGNGNLFTVSIQYKRSSDSSWITWGSNYSTNSGSILTKVIDTTNWKPIKIGMDTSYDILITVNDGIFSSSYQITIPETYALMEFYKDGTGISIGKMATQSELFDVGLETKFGNNVDIEGALTTNGAATFNGNTFLNTDTYIPSGLKLFYLPGDTYKQTAGVYCAGVLTSSSTCIAFDIPTPLLVCPRAGVFVKNLSVIVRAPYMTTAGEYPRINESGTYTALGSSFVPLITNGVKRSGISKVETLNHNSSLTVALTFADSIKAASSAAALRNNIPVTVHCTFELQLTNGTNMPSYSTAEAPVPAKTYIYNWDFTKSLTDSVASLAATKSSTLTRDTTGLHFNSLTAGGLFLNHKVMPNTTYEIDVSSMNIQNLTRETNGRFFCNIGSASTTDSASGFIMRLSTKKWEFYNSSITNANAVSNSSSLTAFSGKTAKFVFGAATSGYMPCSVYADSTLIASVGKYPTNEYVRIGDVKQCCYSMDITGIRVYTN